MFSYAQMARKSQKFASYTAFGFTILEIIIKNTKVFNLIGSQFKLLWLCYTQMNKG